MAALLMLSVYVCWPRTADLRAFDPSRVAQLETRMWRSYYEQRYAALLADLYALNRDEYGFSPADSLAIAWYAAGAAHTFQPTRSRAEARQALTMVERYYALLRERGGEAFDTPEAARLEFDWWQLRSEHAQPSEYGAVIARASRCPEPRCRVALLADMLDIAPTTRLGSTHSGWDTHGTG